MEGRKVIQLMLIGVVIMYLFTCFYTLEMNPLQWEQQDRAGFLFLLFPFNMIMFMIYTAVEGFKDRDDDSVEG